MRRWAFFMLLHALLAPPTLLAAQTSAYVPLDHWAMPFVEHLIRAGIMKDPDALTRPLRRHAIARAVDSLDPNRYEGETRALIEQLREEFKIDQSGFRAGFDGYGGVGGRTHGRRDPLFPDGDGGFVAHVGFQFWVTQGPFALSTGGLVNSNIRRDPDWTGQQEIIEDDPDRFRVPGRGENAYGSFETPWVEIAFGNLDRNWGPQGFHGLLFSNAPYAYDHFLVRLKTRYVWIETAVSQLDDVDYQGETDQRYWILHRATGNLASWLKLWANQGTLLSGSNQQLEPWALNPFRLNQFSLTEENRADNTNNFLEGAFWLKLGKATLNGSLMIDDYALFSGNPVPNRIAGTLVADGPLRRRTSWSVGYTFVSNLTYRTASPVEGANRRGVGLGRNFSDYDQLTVRVTRAAPLGSVVGGELTVLRHGEGDLRDPFPSDSELPGIRFIHQGISQKTLRLAVSLDSRPDQGFTIRGRAGIHLIDGAEHVSGATSAKFVAEIEVSKFFRLRAADSRP